MMMSNVSMRLLCVTFLVVTINVGGEELAATINDPSFYCPLPTELYQENLFWKAPYGWRDYSTSFAKAIKGFIGAQWIGVNLGKIICLYNGLEDNGLEENDFPIALERDVLIQKPQGQHWKLKPNGYEVCDSDNTMDCLFLPQEVSAQEDAYDFLHALKYPK